MTWAQDYPRVRQFAEVRIGVRAQVTGVELRKLV